MFISEVYPHAGGLSWCCGPFINCFPYIHCHIVKFSVPLTIMNIIKLAFTIII